MFDKRIMRKELYLFLFCFMAIHCHMQYNTLCWIFRFCHRRGREILKKKEKKCVTLNRKQKTNLSPQGLIWVWGVCGGGYFIGAIKM